MMDVRGSLLTIEGIKKLGKEKSPENLRLLISLYQNASCSIDIRREIVSSIGRQKDDDTIYNFIRENIFKEGYMEVVHQMFRTLLYKSEDGNRFDALAIEAEKYFDNEVMHKMRAFKEYKKKRKSPNFKNVHFVKHPILLEGDSRNTLKQLPEGCVSLIFTSPPYYNARVYSDYHSYREYLKVMKVGVISII